MKENKDPRMSSRDSIKVVCRIRPENAIEQTGGYKRCVEHNKVDISVNVSCSLLEPKQRQVTSICS